MIIQWTSGTKEQSSIYQYQTPLVWNWMSVEGVLVLPPFSVRAGEVFIAGALAGEIYKAGAERGEIYRGGTVVGEVQR